MGFGVMGLALFHLLCDAIHHSDVFVCFPFFNMCLCRDRILWWLHFLQGNRNLQSLESPRCTNNVEFCLHCESNHHSSIYVNFLGRVCVEMILWWLHFRWWNKTHQCWNPVGAQTTPQWYQLMLVPFSILVWNFITHT